MVLVTVAFVIASCSRAKEETVECSPESCSATLSEDPPDCEIEDETHCNGAVIETCTGGTWVAGLDCSVTGQICEAPEDVPICTYAEDDDGCPDDHWKCESNKVMFCEEGGVWAENQDCLVEGKTCVEPQDEADADADPESIPDPFCEAPMDGCTEGIFRCNDDTVLEQCMFNNVIDATLWSYEDDCDDWYPALACDNDLITFLNAADANCASTCEDYASYSVANFTCNEIDSPPLCVCAD
jgi:hypothetical protein